MIKYKLLPPHSLTLSKLPSHDATTGFASLTTMMLYESVNREVGDVTPELQWRRDRGEMRTRKEENLPRNALLINNFR